MLTVGTILNGAFAMLRQRIGAIGIWALIYLAMTVGLVYAMRPYIAGIATMQAATPGGGAPDLSALTSNLGLILSVYGAMLIVLLVVYTAALRAAVRPEESAFAYLRLGMDELRMVGVALVLFFAFLVLYFGLALVVGLLFGVLALAARDAMFVIGGLSILVILAVMIFFQIRLSLAFALTLVRGRISIGESWRLTRGNFWTLFGAYLVIGLILFAFYFVVFAVTMGPYLAQLGSAGLDPTAMRAAQQAQLARQLGPVSAMTAVGWVLSSLFGVIGLALGAGATGTATLTLLDGEYGDLGEVYA